MTDEFRRRADALLATVWAELQATTRESELRRARVARALHGAKCTLRKMAEILGF